MWRLLGTRRCILLGVCRGELHVSGVRGGVDGSGCSSEVASAASAASAPPACSAATVSAASASDGTSGAAPTTFPGAAALCLRLRAAASCALHTAIKLRWAESRRLLLPGLAKAKV